MKIKKDLVCMIAYILGVPMDLWHRNYDMVQDMDAIQNNEDLKFCRACCYVRQGCLYTLKGITTYKTMDVLKYKDKSSEQYQSFVTVFGFEGEELKDPYDILDLPRKIQIQKLEYLMQGRLRVVIGEFLDAHSYTIDVEDILDVLLFGSNIDIDYWHNAALSPECLRCYPYSRLLNIKQENLPKGNLLYADSTFLSACKTHATSKVDNNLAVLRNTASEIILQCLEPIHTHRVKVSLEEDAYSLEEILQGIRYAPVIKDEKIFLEPIKEE